MKTRLRHLDPGLLIPMLILMAMGLLNLYSAGLNGQPVIWAKQAFWNLLSLGVLTLMAHRPPQRFFRLSPWLYGLGLLLLLLVLIPGIGLKLGAGSGARRWLGLKALNFQPSEMVKWFTLLYVSDYLGRRPAGRIEAMDLVAVLSAVLLPVLLVFKQPDLGMAVSFLPILTLIVLIRGLNLKWAALLVAGAILFGTVAWKANLIKDYQKRRVVSFLNPDMDTQGKNYQTNQSRMAIASGGFFGRGFTRGTQTQLNFLPVKTTDFIFAAWAEERGYLGVLLVLGLFGAFLSRMLGVARIAKSLAEMYFVTGASAIISLHLFVNVAMVAGFLPNKGMVLPFFSYGGSSTLSYFLGLGMVMAIAYRAKMR